MPTCNRSMNGPWNSAFLIAKRFRHAEVDLTVVDRTNHHLLQPVVYQLGMGILSEGDIAPPIRDVLRHHRSDQLLTVVPATDDRRPMAARRRDRPHRLAISWHSRVSTLAAIITIVLLTASVHAAPLHESSAMPAAATEGISAAGISDRANPGPCDATGLAPPPERCMPGTHARGEYGPKRLLTIDDPYGRSAGETLPVHPVGESPDVLPERHGGADSR